MTIDYEEHVKGDFFDFDPREQIESVIEKTMNYLEFPYEFQVSVTLTDEDEIREINKEYRDIDRATDVLSFPMMEYDTPGDYESDTFEQTLSISPETEEVLLGDIVLCGTVIKRQALEYNHSERRELSFLVVHSLLHLSGYDHMEEEERKVMEEKQREIMNYLGIHR